MQLKASNGSLPWVFDWVLFLVTTDLVDIFVYERSYDCMYVCKYVCMNV